MRSAPAARRASTEPVDGAVPPEVLEVFGGFGLAAGNANVIMQLARLPIGHGVARSRVESGRVDRHPLKRLRTTSAYLAISMLGSERERLAMRREVGRAHALVHSQPGDPVAYDAFDPELQLWVAACLYRGTEDVLRLLRGPGAPPSEERLEALYQHCRRFATTLQVPEQMWPPHRAAFEAYWEQGLRQIQMDELTRAYLQGIAQLSFLIAPLGRWGAWLAPPLAALGRFFTLGHLPEPFRRELGLPWSERDQRRFDAFIGALAALTRRLPGPLRRFPMNLYLADTRRRIRSGRPIV
jgi:uncharacterized protein (DUF2236 family)